MSRVLSRLAGIALVGLLGAGCAEAIDAPDACAPGRSVGAASPHLCLFEGAATIETGFVCPDSLPYTFEFDGGVLCSDAPEPPDVVIDLPAHPDAPGRPGSAAPSDPPRSPGGSQGDAGTTPSGGSGASDDDEVEDHEEAELDDEDEAEEHEEDEEDEEDEVEVEDDL